MPRHRSGATDRRTPTDVPRAARWAASAAGGLSRMLGRGSGGTMPGRVLLALCPDALGRLAAGRRIVLVSGTNGKTTTTRLLTHALSVSGSVVSNTGGANLVTGLVSALLAAPPSDGSSAVLEVDEVALGPVLAACQVQVVVLLNLTRDQLDRTSEVGDHVRRWSEALTGRDEVEVVANCDDPLVVTAVLAARPHGRRVHWVAVGQPYREDTRLCPRCGSGWDRSAENWRCDACGLARPVPACTLVEGPAVVAGDQHLPLVLGLPGRANAANAVMALAAATVLGVPADVALDAMTGVTEVEGRYARAPRGDHSVLLLLAKNPAGWQEALTHLSPDGPVVIAVNARAADGADTSWLWDVPFERLRGREVVATGERAADLSVRLGYAEVPHRTAPDAASAVDLLPAGDCSLIANYTAFVAARVGLGASPTRPEALS